MSQPRNHRQINQTIPWHHAMFHINNTTTTALSAAKLSKEVSPMNDSILSLQAKLDKAKSLKNINSDIQDIQRRLDHLKLQTEIDPKSISALNRQLDHLLGQKITLSDIEVNESQVQQVGQQIGNTISRNMTDGVRKASEEITTEIEEIGNQIENIQSSSTGINKLLDPLKSFITNISLLKKIQNIGKCRMSVRISKCCCCFEYALHA